MNNRNKKWSDEEIELLRELSGKLTKKGLAQKLGRTETAIFNKQQRLGIGGFKQNSDMLTRHMAGQILGLSNCRLIRWEKQFGLKTYSKKPFKMYRQHELLKFLKEHQELWNAKLVTDDTIFMGEKWFVDKYRADSDKGYFWTNDEISRVKFLRHEGYSIPEIARKMGRSNSSIKYFLYMKGKKRNAG